MRRASLLFLLLTGVSLWAAPSETELFSEAESRYLARNYPAAIETYDDFLQSYPLSDLASDAQYRKAVCLYRLQKYQDASRLLHDVELRYRSTRYLDYVPFWQGLTLYQLKSYSLAVESLDAFLARVQDPELTPQALLHKALCMVELDNDTGALEAARVLVKDYRSSDVFPYSAVLMGSLLRKEKAFDELLSFTAGVDPSGFPANWRDDFLLSRAEGLWEAGRVEEAVGLYRPLTSAADETALTAYRRLFEAAQRRKDLAEMQSLTQAAEGRFGATPVVLTDLWARVGVASFRQGNLDSARLFLMKVWDLRGSQAPGQAVPIYLAEIALSRKDAAGARAILEEYVSSAEGARSADAVMRLGDVALQAGDMAVAEKWYGKFIESFPDSPRLAEAGYLLAYVTYRSGRVDESFALVARFLQDPADSAYKRDLLRLRIVLLKKSGSFREAAGSLSDYISRYPDDVRSRIDLLKVLFTLKDYSGILREADAVTKRFPVLQATDPYAHQLVLYLRGLSLIARKEYRTAIRDLEAIGKDQAEKAGLGSIMPYAGYYLAWAYVKSGSFDRAARILDGMRSAYPGHVLASQILFLDGWSHFSLGEFDRASEAYLQTARREGTSDLGEKAGYLSAKSLFNAKKLPEASVAFQAILRSSPPSSFADSAMFDYAGVLVEQGSIAKAADTYKALADGFPSSPLAEEAIYRRAETYYSAGMLAQAKPAFSDYRSRYPKGKLVDAALYWGGEAAMGSGEKFGAVLLWGELIDGFAQSTFRATALRKSAEIYAEARDFTRALGLYNRLISEYPEEARAAKTDIAAERLRYQSLGFGDAEAELTARIARESGAAKTEATLELARLYVYGGENRAEQGYTMLTGLAKSSDAEIASKALYLLGEYFYRKGDLVEASRQFLQAAAKGAADTEFAPSAIYRAAEMMKLGHRQDEVQALTKRLSDNFPSSQWTVKARKLLEADK